MNRIFSLVIFDQQSAKLLFVFEILQTTEEGLHQF